MTYLTNGHNKLAYELSGDSSDSVILLHGCGVDHTSLLPQAEHLSRRFRVLSPDLRGHGESCPSQEPYDTESFANDIALLCQHLDLQRSVVIGHSMGGNVALTLRALHPELVSAIVLIDSALFIPEPQKEKLRSDFTTALQDHNVLAFFKQALHSMCLEGEAKSSEIIDAIAIAPDVLRLALKAHTVDFDSEAVFAGCNIPVGYIHSAMPFVSISSLREAYPNLLFGETLGVGHFSPIESAGQVNAMIDSFLTHAASQIRSSRHARGSHSFADARR